MSYKNKVNDLEASRLSLMAENRRLREECERLSGALKRAKARSRKAAAQHRATERARKETRDELARARVFGKPVRDDDPVHEEPKLTREMTPAEHAAYLRQP